MALTFPANPTPNQVFTDKGKVWVWDATHTVWRMRDDGITPLLPADAAGYLANDGTGGLTWDEGQVSQTPNGYSVDSRTGLIMQWGMSIAHADGAAIIFPLAFPNAAFSVTASPAHAVGVMMSAVGNITNTQFTARHSSSCDISWIAIGH